MDLEAQEREKYRKVWDIPQYSDYSPGEHLVEIAITYLGMKQGTLIDYGCGTGRATKKFQDLGYAAMGVDFASNCLQTDVPFRNACLWDLPPMSSDWAFCSDVMEHIPEEKVEVVFEAIRNRTLKGAFFQVHTANDGFGARVDEVLHLTVRPGEWWKEQAEEFWSEVDIVPGERGHRVLLTCRN